VVRVVDGDTIVIDRSRGNERVRYIGVDTPESVKPDTPVEFMAKEAAAANEALVGGREVVLETDVSDTDQYDRLLRYVWLRDGDGWVLANLELVRRGFAQVATFPPDVRWTEAFLAAQRVAHDAGLGLWGSATAAP
jgi:micrococcal nuclease